PIVSVDTGFLPTHFGARDAAISTKGAVMGSGTGTWGVGVQIAKVSFVKDLTHKIKLAYYQGTNDSKIIKDQYIFPSTRNCNDMYLTDKDHAWEVNFDHEYKIYENLTAMLELGYINLDLNRGTWGRNGYGSDGDRNNSAWKAQVLFRYSF
ncbi:MAG: porin, partial [Desulfovibrio sp.]|nr:porin [Desulfovibrio sp.]